MCKNTYLLFIRQIFYEYRYVKIVPLPILESKSKARQNQDGSKLWDKRLWLHQGGKTYFRTSWYFSVLLYVLSSQYLFLLNFSLNKNLEELLNTFMHFDIFHRRLLIHYPNQLNISSLQDLKRLHDTLTTETSNFRKTSRDY